MTTPRLNTRCITSSPTENSVAACTALACEGTKPLVTPGMPSAPPPTLGALHIGFTARFSTGACCGGGTVRTLSRPPARPRSNTRGGSSLKKREGSLALRAL